MSEDARDPIGELESQMRAAGELIDSLEGEVVGLRRDLEEAGEALRAAQAEVAARERALDEAQGKQRLAGEDVSMLRSELADLRSQHADEQLELRNTHIREMADLRRQLEGQRQADLEAANADERVETLKEEIRREREATEERHRADMEALKLQSQQWEEKLREGYTELEEKHNAELERTKAEAQAKLERTRSEAEAERAELERRLREEFEGRLAAEQLESAKRQEEALQTLRSAAAGRELQMQRDYKTTIESREEQIETLRRELEERNAEAERRLKAELREVKRHAEARENELRRAQAAKISEANVAAERRVAALQAQREADNRALIARHAEELATVRRQYEERLAAEDERRKAETWALEERLAGLRIERETEVETYKARLVELEAERLSHRRDAQEDLERASRGFGEEIARLESRIAELEEELDESEALRSSLLVEYEQLYDRLEGGEGWRSARRPEEGEGEDGRLREVEAGRLLAEERVQALEDQLRAAREEARETAAELARTRENLRRLSDPEHRLRAGIELFNASEHTRTVASISKGLGLPLVNASTDGGPGEPGRPVLTFVWGDISWRRYVADPTEGVEEPRVYLVGTSNDPADITTGEPNARMDANGRLTLGVQAR